MDKLIKRLSRDLRALQQLNDRVPKFGANSDTFYKPGSNNANYLTKNNIKCMDKLYNTRTSRFGATRYEYQF